MFFVCPLVMPVFGVFQPCGERVSAPVGSPLPASRAQHRRGRRAPTVTAIVMAACALGRPPAALALQPL